jgi:ABC-type transport system involved in multi-copper enzyme maturation permease subunit
VLDIYGNVDPTLPCVSIYYSPNTDPETESIMAALAARTGLTHGVDIVGVTSAVSLLEVLALKVGRYDAALSFDTLKPPPCWPKCAEDGANDQFPSSSKKSEDAADLAAHTLLTALEERSKKIELDRMAAKLALASCPLTQNIAVTYTLWLNTTQNANDRVPGWVNDESSYEAQQSQGPNVPPRYWALQHNINLAITDVMSGVGVPDILAQVAEEKAQKVIEAQEKKQQQALKAAASASNSIHLTLFSFFNGRNGASGQYDDSSDYSLADYQNDSVTKWAGSSIISIAVLVLTLLGMQLLSYEKQQRIIGILRIMGMKEGNYWNSWFLLFAFLAFLASLLATGMGKISGLQVWHYCDFSIQFVALFLYIVCMAAIAMLFTSFINRTIILNIVGFLLFFMAIISNVFFGNVTANLIYRPDMPNFVQILVYIFPWFHYSKIWADVLLHTSVITFNNATSHTTSHVQFEYHWSQITQEQRVYEDCAYGDESCCAKALILGDDASCYNVPSTSSAMWNLVILMVFYMAFAWYLAQVFGGSLGMNRRFWFLVTPEFWGFDSEDDKKLAQLQAMHAGGAAENLFLGQDRLVNEQYLSLKNQELRTYKLSKSYKKTSALKEVTLKMHRDEVFCLLGHNGAGSGQQCAISNM